MRTYPSDLSDRQWQFIEKFLNTQRKHSLRDIWNAILYLHQRNLLRRVLQNLVNFKINKGARCLNKLSSILQ